MYPLTEDSKDAVQVSKERHHNIVISFPSFDRRRASEGT